MAGEWFPLLMLLGLVVVAVGAVLRIRRGVIDYLFLDIRRDETPMEFWGALLIITAGAIGAIYVLLA